MSVRASEERSGHEAPVAGSIAAPDARDAANARCGTGTSRAFVGLGSNEGDRLAHLRRAVERIDAGVLPGSEAGCVVAVSGVVETRPVGPDPTLAGGPYLNAALEVRLRADASLDAIVDGLLEIEATHGRVRRTRWEARPLDLDLLLVLDDTPDGWVARRVTTEHVTVPHPRMPARDFVLAPLADLLPREPVVDGKTATERLEALRDEDRTILRSLDASLR